MQGCSCQPQLPAGKLHENKRRIRDTNKSGGTHKQASIGKVSEEVLKNSAGEHNSITSLHHKNNNNEL